MLPPQPTFSQLLNQTQDYSQQAAYDEQYGFFDNTQRSFTNEDGSNYFAQGEAGEEEEAEYYGEEEEAGDDNSKGKGAKAEESNKRWENFEDITLCTCWCNKTDSTWDTKSDKYWSVVTDMYNMDIRARGGICRGVKALKNRWYRTIRVQGRLWSASSKKVRALIKSGENEYKIMQRIEERYRRDHPTSKSFKLMHCIDILMESRKFAATCTTGTYPSFKDMDLGDDDDENSEAGIGGENVETPKQGSNSVSNSASTQTSGKRTRESTSNVVNSPVKRTRRPPGVKKTKAQLKFDAELPERTAALEAMTAARSAEM